MEPTQLMYVKWCTISHLLRLDVEVVAKQNDITRITLGSEIQKHTKQTLYCSFPVHAATGQVVRKQAGFDLLCLAEECRFFQERLSESHVSSATEAKTISIHSCIADDDTDIFHLLLYFNLSKCEASITNSATRMLRVRSEI